MGRYLREVVGNLSTLNSPPPPSFLSIIYLLIKPMFGIFTLAIKFDCLFLGIFQSFYWFVALIFDEFTPPPLNICFKRCFKSLFSLFQRKKKQSPKS